MKKISISIQFESQKLDALKMYIQKKDLNLEREVTEFVDKLYEKHVPQNVREYIDITNESKPKRKAQSKKNNTKDMTLE